MVDTSNSVGIYDEPDRSVPVQSDIASLESLFAEPAIAEIGQKCLRFQLYPESTALLPVEEIAAVVPVAAIEILPVPDMPNCVLGIYNWRGEMLWLVDLGCQTGFVSLFHQGDTLTSVMAIVVQTNGQSLGLVVSQVHDLEQHDLQQLQPPSAGLFPSQLLPFVKGYLINNDLLPNRGQRSTVLDVNAIVQDPLLRVHQGR
ncbi:chemotaxis protein CheW [Oculatella sp. LEGE 06141]|uniref:chemotaxis protein CheW n=1 Tax=Oculatella sp. LEGE 06141 TaxID=1828648 RepID=UPI00187EA7DC|nr:chemotaxis protein CheW [Oculatella sp. LEGE 06141]MBE9182147.1 chemotaxis protein CheW [Oculatella sp. LEGE 06141]